MSNQAEKNIEILYIIDPLDFKGQIYNSASSSDKGVFVHYMDKPTTFEEYKKLRGNENLIALSWEDFDRKYNQPYLKTLQGKFKSITEKKV